MKLQPNRQSACPGFTSIPRTVAETYEGRTRRDIRRAREPFENHCHWREARRGRQISNPQGLVFRAARRDVVLAARVGVPARLHWRVGTLRPRGVADHVASRHRTPYMVLPLWLTASHTGQRQTLMAGFGSCVSAPACRRVGPERAVRCPAVVAPRCVTPCLEGPMMEEEVSPRPPAP